MTARLIRSTPRLLATRTSKSLIDTLETLCLITGTNKRYRIYTTTDESLIEGHWDLDPIEFDTVDDEQLKTYLIESFWLLQISQHELQKACELYDQGTAQTQVGAVNDQAAIDLGSLGILLIEMFNRIQTIDPRDAHSIEVLNYIDANLSKLESLPALPQSVRNSIHGCRLTYDEIRREVVLRNRELGH
jgi:hypothetical protein